MTMQWLGEAIGPKTSAVGSHDFVDLALKTVREHLEMEVAYLSEFVDGHAIFRAVSAPGLEEMIKPGDSRALSDIYCQHILDGRLPNVIQDTHDEPLALTIPITHEIPVRSHVSVPVHRPDGSVYGMFCCLSPRPNRSLNDRDLKVMHTFSNVAKRQLHADIDLRHARDMAHAAIDNFLNSRNYDIALQPIIPVGQATPCGFEALCRFDSIPYRPPNLWFDDARLVGKDIDLELAVIARALGLLKHLPEPVYLSVNASPVTIASGRLSALFAGLPATRIVLEVTEHEIVKDYVPFAAELHSLVQTGIRVAIDDVGAGYSGLSHILKTRPSLIKLDMELVRNIDRDTAQQSMVRGLAHFAASTTASLVAEGVETAAELETLSTLGVDLAQGYLLGRPSDLKAAQAWFAV